MKTFAPSGCGTVSPYLIVAVEKGDEDKPRDVRDSHVVDRHARR